LLSLLRQRRKSVSTSPEVSRRGFLKTGLAAGALTGAGLGGFYFGYNTAVGSPVRVGVIGTGDEGSVLIGALNPKYVEVKAIADIRPYNQFRAFHGDWGVPVRPGLMSVYGWKSEKEAKKHVKVYGPYTELLANAKADGIEAIIIATPLHLHAPIAIAAMNQGLHVITEKLMAHDVGQCKEMARVAKDRHVYLAMATSGTTTSNTGRFRTGSSAA
jgi:predicted dehydrogenase